MPTPDPTDPNDSHLVAFEARISVGEKIEPGDWMPDEYRRQLIRMISQHAHSEMELRPTTLRPAARRRWPHSARRLPRPQRTRRQLARARHPRPPSRRPRDPERPTLRLGPHPPRRTPHRAAGRHAAGGSSRSGGELVSKAGKQNVVSVVQEGAGGSSRTSSGKR